MALPDGYDVIQWDKLRAGDEIFILEDGRAKPYGPYKVVDPGQRRVDDISTGGYSSGEFNIGQNEIVGKKSTGKPNVTPIGQVVPTSVSATLGSGPSARAVMEAMRDWLVADIASKAQNLDASTRARLTSQAEIAGSILEQKLIDWKNTP